MSRQRFSKHWLVQSPVPIIFKSDIDNPFFSYSERHSGNLYIYDISFYHPCNLKCLLDTFCYDPDLHAVALIRKVWFVHG